MTTLKRKIATTIAEHLADKVIETIDEYYQGAGFDPRNQPDLRKNLARDIAIELGDVL